VSFLQKVEQAKAYLREHGRVSLRALALEFRLDEQELELLVEELTEVQLVAAHEGKVLSWVGPAAREAPEEAPRVESEPAPADERRHLTVLFCDLVGSTRLASRLDPEDWREVLRTYQESAAEIVRELEGHVAQYLGDGLLVYFGFPRAHEDDAERAVRAGLGIVGALGPLNERLEAERGIRLSVRIGIHTGPVVVGEMGGGATRERLASGDTTNLAARIQEKAGVDQVLISGEVFQLVRGSFVTADLGRRSLKGIAEPVALRRVLQPSGVRGRVDGSHGHLTPFVGRSQELGLLLDRWDRVLEGEGQTVLVSGEAGIGKSRLIQALQDRLADRPHTWLECRCSPYTQRSAFRPVIDLVEEGVALRHDDGPQARLRKIEVGFARVGLDPLRAVPLVADLLGLPPGDGCPPPDLPAELRRERTLDLLVAWALGLGELQPVVLFVEDLHWCDPSSLEYFGRLMEQLAASRLLMILTARPEFTAPWAQPKIWTPIVLPRFGRRQARELVVAVQAAQPLPEEAVTKIVERADGVALYLEELTRAALDSGQSGAPVSIPATLQDSLMARLDRLSSAKEVAQLGSVIGREFPYRLLEAVSELEVPALREGLDRLVHANVVLRRGTPPDAIYTFKHALIQETAYESLLRRRRRQLHARVAEVLAERFPERVESEPEELARHHAEAGRWTEAASYYKRAGERATLRSAYAEAVAHLSAGIEILGRSPASAARDRTELALRISLGPPLIGIRGYGNPEVETTYLRARKLSEEAGETSPLFESIWGLANYYQARSQLPLAKDLGRQLVVMAERAKDPQLASWAHLQFGATRFWMGQYRASLQQLEQAIESYDPAEYRFLPGGPDPCVAALAYSGLGLWQCAEPARARESAARAIQLARQRQHAFSLALALCFSGSLHQLLGDPASVRATAEEVIALAAEHAFPVWRAWGRTLLGWSLAHAGEGAQGVEVLQLALTELAGSGSTLGGPAGLMMLAEAQRAAGRWSDVAATAAGALSLAEQQGQRAWDAELLRLRGEALLAERGAGDPEAEGCLRRALGTARREESIVYELRASVSLARALVRCGAGPEARPLLARAIERAPDDAAHPDLCEAKTLLGELS
jgi:class 3 adenylate cyclase/tetratricopeptide (TPR) repeat protein